MSLTPLRYEAEVARWVSAFKYHRHWSAGRLLAQLLAHALFHHYQDGLSGPEPAAAAPQPPLPAAPNHGHSHLLSPAMPDRPAASASGPHGAVWPECLIPVPMHPRRLLHRGYNQAALLAQDLSRSLGLPWLPQGLQRVRETLAQSELDEAQRRLNLKRAFRAPSDLPRHVALVDDVVTTTSTVRACARALAAAGVERIDVWAVARTP